MKKILIYISLVLSLWIFLARCILCENRWSDAKALRVFKAKNIPLEIRDTLINNHHIHYAISGSDSLPILVFLHGSPGSWMNYMKFMWDTSFQKKFKVVSIDRPGFGYSNFGEALPLQEQCDLILPVLRSLKRSQQIYLCGHSYGAPMAIKLAAMDSTLFNTIILTSGSIDLHQEEPEMWRRIMNVKPFYWLLPGAFAPSNTELLYLKKDLLTLQKEFEKVKCNVHFIHGTNDTWVPIQNISYGFKMLTNAKTIQADTIFGADHQIPWSNRDDFKKILLKLY